MAQPTQDFPPWLAPSAVVITDAAGDPVTTSTTILYLPPTYFGPSIPLGSLYSFGGSSEPATVVLPSPTPQTITTTLGASTTIAITTTAAPTTSVSLSTTSATPTSTTSVTPTSSLPTTLTSSTSGSSTTSSSSVSLTTSLTASSPTSLSSTTFSSTSSTPSPTSGPVAATGLSRGQLVGVIVASILGVIFLFVLALFFFLWYKGRRNRRQFASLSPIDDDYYVVPPGGRTPGEGSPRHSGEEADPFLQERSHGHGATAGETSAAGAAAGMAQVAGHGASRPYSSSRVPPPVVGSGSSGSTDSNASGFGELLPTQSLSLLPSQQALENRQSGGSQLSGGAIDPMNQGHVAPEGQDQYEDGEYTGAYAYSQDPMLPPRLLDPDTTFAPLLGAFRPPKPPSLSHQPSFQDAEAAEVYTAQRVRAEDLASRSPPRIEAGPSHRTSSGLLGSLGLGVLANIGRRSWFKQFDSPRNSASYEPTYTAEPLSERDIETGRSVLLTPDRPVDSFGNRPRGTAVGFYADDTRPISTVSGRSGNSNGTTYHDAQTSLPGTPHIAPLPRALTPSEPAHLPPMPMLEHSWLSSPLARPPAYEDPFSTSPTGSPGRRASPPLFTIGTPEVDVLDMPAPTALNRFASISSLKEMTTGTSTGSGVGTSTKGTPFPPPGLETIRPVGSTGWGTSSSVTASPSPGSFAYEGMGGVEQQGLRQHAAGITFDVLEDAPPDAEQGWRSMAMARAGGGLVGDTGRRGTFGLYVHGVPEFMSEQGSLHSMRSHFSPSNRSTGSAPASRHGAGSLNSTSSRPSAHSAASSAASAMHSLGRTGSIGSENRKRVISPAVSAFGINAHGSGQRRASSGGSGSGTGGSHSQSGSGSNGSNSHEPALPSIIGSPPLAHTSTGLRGMTSGSTMAMDADTSFGSSTVRCGPQSRNPSPGPSPLSVSFPLTAPWVGGLDDEWQPTA